LRRHNRGLVIIAIYKWLTAALCAGLAFGLLKLLHQDVGEAAERFIRSMGVDPDNHMVERLLNRLSLIEDPQLAKLSAASFGYCALFLIEGTGLYFEKRWAEYLTLIATASFLPFEIYAIIHRVDVLKISILLINIAVMIFLVITIRNKTGRKRRSR
jgi:uncharacterized membrane protein (DUF2068 family)